MVYISPKSGNSGYAPVFIACPASFLISSIHQLPVSGKIVSSSGTVVETVRFRT